MNEIFTCQQCGVTKQIKVKPSCFGKKKFCDKKCQNLGMVKMFAGEKNPAFGRVYRSKETHPEWADKISTGMKRIGHIQGDKNPMRNPEVAARMSVTRRAKVTSDPEYRRQRSESTKQAWQDGRYDGVKVGRCKWFDYVKPDGSVVKVQGTWELAFVKWLDSQGLNYVTHRDRLSYVDAENQKRNYYPDFYVDEWRAYVDVKSDYHLSLQPEKLDWVRRDNPNITIRLLLEDELKQMGVL